MTYKNITMKTAPTKFFTFWVINFVKHVVKTWVPQVPEIIRIKFLTIVKVPKFEIYAAVLFMICGVHAIINIFKKLKLS
jgi:hypothetical protein